MVSRAAAFGAAWYLLPFWAFVVFAVLLYIIPWFGAQKLLWPFLVFMALLAVLETNIVFACAAALTFFLILGVKDLVFLLRADRYETLTAFLLVLLAVTLFREDPLTHARAGLAAGTAAFFLFRGYFGYVEGHASPPQDAAATAGVAALILGAFTYATSFAPLVPLARMVLFSAAGIALVELGSAVVQRSVERQLVLGTVSVFLAVFVVTLTATAWGI